MGRAAEGVALVGTAGAAFGGATSLILPHGGTCLVEYMLLTSHLVDTDVKLFGVEVEIEGVGVVKSSR